jgi:nucleoside-diphosphate-sugar epimerase
MNTVLILGARGRFGQAATQAFASAGWRVLAQARPGKAVPPGASTHTTCLSVPLNDTAALLKAAQGAHVVVHALNPRNYTDTAWTREAPALLETSLHLAQQLGATLMMPVNVYNFGTQLPSLLREDTPQAPDHTKAHVRVAMEQRLQRAAREGAVRSIVVRAGDFFGQGQGSWLDLVLAKHLARGVVTLPGPRDVPHAWAYLPDLAATFVRVAEQREQVSAFAALHFRGHTLTLDDWVSALQVGRKPLQLKPLPWTLMRVLAPMSPTVRSLCTMRYLWQRAHAMDNTRLLALVGTEPHTPFDLAARQALQNLELAAASTPTAKLA